MVEPLHKAKNTILRHNFITVNISTKHFGLYLVFGSLVTNTVGKKQQCRRKMEARHLPVNKVLSESTYLVSFSKQPCSD